MMGFRYYVVILFTCFLGIAKSQSIQIDSLFLNSPNSYLHKQINNRQDTLRKYYVSNEALLVLNEVDTIQLFIELNNTSKANKSKYLSYLLDYIRWIEKPNANNYFSSGRYLSCLKFYPAIIDYSNQKRLTELIEQNKLLALKSIRLYRSEPEAKLFLDNYIYENPDDVIRNIDEFAESNYAEEILMKLTAYSPLSTERYLGGFNTVNRMIKMSEDPIAKAIVKLDSTRTNRHINFIFLNEIITNNQIPNFATGIANNKIAFFKELSKIHFNPNGIGKYSADRELSIIASDIIREINYYYSNGFKNNVSSIVSSFNKQEMYLIFFYGYQNANTFSFGAFLKLIEEKGPELFNKEFYNTISKSDLENFIKTSDQFAKTQDILALTEPAYRDQLLMYLSTNEEVKMDFNTYLDNFKNNLVSTNIAPIPTKSITTSGITLDMNSDIKPVVSIETTPKSNEIVSANNPPQKQSLNDPIPTKDIVLDNKDISHTNINVTHYDTKPIENIPNTSVVLNSDKNIELKNITNISTDTKLNLINPTTPLKSKDEILSINKSDLSSITTNAILPTKEVKHVAIPIIINIRQDEKYTYEILRNIDNTIGNINYTQNFLDKSYSRNVLNTIAKMHPDDIFRQVKNLQSKYWIKDVLERATKESPVSYKRYLPNENHPVRYILNNSTDSTILMLNQLYTQFGYKSNLYNFIDDIIKNKKTAVCVDSICKNKNASFKEMISIITQKNCIGKYSLEKELESNSLTTVRAINDNLSTNTDIKFQSVKDYTPEELYVLMIYGEDELFKSSFTGIYNLFLLKLQGKNTYEFLQKIDFLHFRTFLKILANFNKTEGFLNNMSADQRLLLITKMVKNLEVEKYNPSEVIYVAEAIPGFKLVNDRAVINTMIRKEFERLQAEHSGTGVLLYGLLASIIEKDAVAEVSWYKEIKADFQLPNLDRITINVLKVNNIVVQQHFFYNDEDGKSSFNNFISTFKSMANWEIINKETYVQINSTSGNKVIILANKPEYEQNGMNEIQKFIKDNQYTVTVVVHRGHSFHTEKTLSVIPPTTKLLVVGSCGGYYKLPIAIERAPDAQIVSTKQIGTMRVNDPIIKTICEDIRIGKDIIWSDFWPIIENESGKTAMFYDYVPPNKNLGSLFLNAYYNAIEKSLVIE